MTQERGKKIRTILFFMEFSKYLKRVQNLSLIKRKIIFWVIIIFFGLIFFIIWVRNIKQKINIFSKEKIFEEIKVPELEEKIKSLPKPEIPKTEIEEDIKKLEEIKKDSE